MLKLIGRQHFTPERLEDINRYLATMEAETSRCGEIVKDSRRRVVFILTCLTSLANTYSRELTAG